AALITTSWPVTAACNAWASSTSTFLLTTPARSPIFDVSRAMAVTLWPRRRASSNSWLPARPVAPMIAILLMTYSSWLEFKGALPLHLALGDFAAQLQRADFAQGRETFFHGGDQRGRIPGPDGFFVEGLDVIGGELHRCQGARPFTEVVTG